MIFRKDISKVKNTLLKWIQRTPNMTDFYEMDIIKEIVILVNVDEMYKILKSLLGNRFFLRDKGGIG